MIVHCAHDAIVPLRELKPHPRNRNKHPESQIAALAKILAYSGFRNVVKVSKRSGFVTAGHGRIEAARVLGWTSVPVNFQDYDSDEMEYADLIADNAIADQAELDRSGVNIDLAELGPDFDLEMLGIENFTLDPPVSATELPDLPDGDRAPFQQMAFTLHDDQVEQVKRAIELAKAMGAFENTENENGNGNALARICETFLTQNGNG